MRFPPPLARPFSRRAFASLSGVTFALVLLASLTGLACDSRVPLGTRPSFLDGGAGNDDAVPSGDGGTPTVWPWTATFESGTNWSEWTTATVDITGGEAQAVGSRASLTPPFTPAPTMRPGSQRCAALTLGQQTLGNDPLQAVRFYRQGVFPTKTRFGAWFYFPTNNIIPNYWMLMQFIAYRKNQWMWDVDLTPSPDGMALALFDQLNQSLKIPVNRPSIPIGEWVHIEVSYTQSTMPAGSIELFQNGVSIINVENVVTAVDDHLQFLVGSCAPAGKITPNPVLYLDDVRIEPEN